MNIPEDPREEDATTQDGFVAKYDSNGSQVWLNQLRTTGDESVDSLAIDLQGNLLVVGKTTGNLYATNNGENDIFCVKYTPSGTVISDDQFGTSAHDFVAGIITSSDGGFYIAGTTEGSLYGTSTGMEDAYAAKFGAVSTPRFNPDGGVRIGEQNVVISSATDGATIRYTSDGTDPNDASTLYTTPIHINQSGTTLKAKAWKIGFSPSNIKTATYKLKVPTPTKNRGQTTN